MLIRYITIFSLISCIVWPTVMQSHYGPWSVKARTFSESTRVQSKQPARRALLIGIGNYEHDPDFDAGSCQRATRRPLLHKQTPSENEGFRSLSGTMNDVCAISELLIDTYNFEPANIHILTDKDATRDGILSAFKRYLIDEAEPGDIGLFFYSGHGSQIRNSRGGEPDQLEESIVPIDWKRPITKREDVKDIRDKEIFKLFREASKKITLTALFDSCHSGGISRGGITSKGRAKTGPPELKFDLAEPPDGDQKNVDDENYLERAGVLVISAAREDQIAEENPYGDPKKPQQDRGTFTYSLIKVLQAAGAGNLSAARIFDRLVVQMKGASQEPVIIGSAARRRATLFGEPVDQAKRPEVNVVSVDYAKGVVILQGGRAMGFDEGCEFIKKAEPGKTDPARIRIKQRSDYVKSVAEVIADNTAARLRIARTIRSNDVFVLDKWAAPNEPNLLVWIPPARLTTAQLSTSIDEIEKLDQSDKVELVADPTVRVAAHFLFHDGTNWLLKLPDDQTIAIGPTLTANAVLDRLSTFKGKATLFYSLPPSIELAARIKLGVGTSNSAIGLATTPTEAHYWLVGHYSDKNSGAIEYAWLLPEATVGIAKPGEALTINAASSGVSPLPPLTDWKSTAADLEDLALPLGRIRGWVKLVSPESAGGGFPYHLILKNKKGEVLSPSNAVLEEGETLTMALVADENQLRPNMKQRHVYVFVIDRSGTISLLYPYLKDQGDPLYPFIDRSTNQLPPQEIEFSPPIQICGPDPAKSGCNTPGELGVETYVMLTTDEALPNPLVLESEGVHTMNASRTASSPLQDLLSRISGTTRSGTSIVPVNWSIEQVFFQSVSKKE